MSGRFRVAVLGAGVGAQHVAAYRALPDRFEIAAICDLDAARAQAIAGGARVETDAAVAFDDPAIDIVDICLPPHLHVPMTLRALATGKHVICEKPLACSLADMDRLEAAERTAPGRIFPVFQYRYGRAMAQLKALIAEGLTGPAFAASLETHWRRGADYYTAPWRGTWDGEQGGAVLGHAIHAHDLVTHLIGPATTVIALTATLANSIETEDCAAIAMRLSGGALATSSVTLGAADDTTRIRFCFQGLTAESGTSPYAPMQGDWRFTARDGDQRLIDEVTASVGPVIGGFTGFLSAVAHALNGDSTNIVDLTSARHSLEIVTAIYQSAMRGEAVVLPPGKDTPLYQVWAPNDARRDGGLTGQGRGL